MEKDVLKKKSPGQVLVSKREVEKVHFKWTSIFTMLEVRLRKSEGS